MPDIPDFLAQSWVEVDRELLYFRDLHNEQESKNPIREDDIVVLAVMDGIAEHKRHHRNFSENHYADFTAHCQRVMRAKHGKVMNVYEPTRGVACGWFADKQDAVNAAAQIVAELLSEIADYRPAWQNERHALCAIGSSEYSAFRLLQMGKRDFVVMETEIWDTYPAEVQALLGIARVFQPDCEARGLAIRETIDSNVNAMQRSLEELQTEAAAEQLATRA